MNIFSFRAECVYDVNNLVTKLVAPYTLTVKPDPITAPDGKLVTVPDVTVQLECELELEPLRDTMYELIDSHVMCQTLRQVPMTENSFDRDRSIPIFKPELLKKGT
jgi:hypothetical protein